MAKKRKKMRGKVAKIILPVVPSEPEKAEITVEDEEDLYKAKKSASNPEPRWM